MCLFKFFLNDISQPYLELGNIYDVYRHCDMKHYILLDSVYRDIMIGHECCLKGCINSKVVSLTELLNTMNDYSIQIMSFC